jgi:hypothetical protein
MILTSRQKYILNQCLGGGPLDRASVLIFGNELGTLETGNLETTINKFISDWESGRKFHAGIGFLTLNIGSPPVNSTFLQFIARLMLALNHKDERFFDKLTDEGKVFLNNYIMNELFKTDTAIINLRPLPQSTERHWGYEDIDEKEYYKMFNFMLSRSSSNPWRNLRVQNMKKAFEIAFSKKCLVLGIGDKNNKKAFFEKEMKVEFESKMLNEDVEVYVSFNPKIILSNYYDNRNGIRLSGLKEIYNFILENKMM